MAKKHFFLFHLEIPILEMSHVEHWLVMNHLQGTYQSKHPHFQQMSSVGSFCTQQLSMPTLEEMLLHLKS